MQLARNAGLNRAHLRTMYTFTLLVSTYVVCERLSVMHEPAGVVENLVQNSESAPLSEQ